MDIVGIRFYIFVRTCVNSTNEVVNFVTRQLDKACSIVVCSLVLGVMYIFLCERYGVCRQDLLNRSLSYQQDS